MTATSFSRHGGEQTMRIDTTTFHDKASRDPALVALYEREPYLTAYAAHTDQRVQRDPQAAVGGKWDAVGQAQRDFLQAHGLKRGGRILDIGCGTGRFARQIVRYLGPKRYLGLDLSPLAIVAACRLAQAEGWAQQGPSFQVTTGSLSAAAGWHWTIVWAYSVVNHLPAEEVGRLFAEVAQLDFGRCYFSYKRAREPIRTGLKQYARPFSELAQLAADAGLKAFAVADAAPLGQPLGVAVRERSGGG